MKHALTRVFSLVTSSVTFFGAAAGAQPNEPSADAAAALPVDIVLVGAAGSDALLDERIRSWFGAETALSITRERVLTAESVLAARASRGVAVWVTLRAPEQARLYFAAAGARDETVRYLLRDVPLDDGLDEIGSERVAQVVHSSVTALVDDSADVIARPDIERELPRPSPPPRAPPPAPAPARVDERPTSSTGAGSAASFAPLAGASYRAAFAGDEGIAHGTGLALGATVFRDRLGIGAVVRGHYAWPHAERFDDLDVTLTELSARLGGSGAFRSGDLTLDLEAGGGMAWVRYDPASTDSGPLPAPRDTDERFFWFASTGARHALGPVQIGARVELELYPSRSHYELDTGRELAVSPRYRPALALELVFE
jgi:hypothetical protein